jgi:hypothetical protein
MDSAIVNSKKRSTPYSLDGPPTKIGCGAGGGMSVMTLNNPSFNSTTLQDIIDSLKQSDEMLLNLPGLPSLEDLDVVPKEDLDVVPKDDKDNVMNEINEDLNEDLKLTSDEKGTKFYQFEDDTYGNRTNDQTMLDLAAAVKQKDNIFEASNLIKEKFSEIAQNPNPEKKNLDNLLQIPEKLVVSCQSRLLAYLEKLKTDIKQAINVDETRRLKYKLRIIIAGLIGLASISYLSIEQLTVLETYFNPLFIGPLFSIAILLKHISAVIITYKSISYTALGMTIGSIGVKNIFNLSQQVLQRLKKDVTDITTSCINSAPALVEVMSNTANVVFRIAMGNINYFVNTLVPLTEHAALFMLGRSSSDDISSILSNSTSTVNSFLTNNSDIAMRQIADFILTNEDYSTQPNTPTDMSQLTDSQGSSDGSDGSNVMIVGGKRRTKRKRTKRSKRRTKRRIKRRTNRRRKRSSRK